MTNMLMTRRPGGRLALACAGLFAVTAPAAAQVTLNASSWVPPGHPIAATMLVPLCADFEKATSGRVKCNVLPKAPVGAVQTFDGVKDGLMDLSFIVNGYTPGRFALSDATGVSVHGRHLRGDFGRLSAHLRPHARQANEYKDVALLGVFTHGPGQMYNTKRPINSLKDLEGLKIRIGGGLVNDIAKALGTVPMLKPAPESYEILSNGGGRRRVLSQGVAGVVQARAAHQAHHLRPGRPLQRRLRPGSRTRRNGIRYRRPTARHCSRCSARRSRAARDWPGTPPTPRARPQCARRRSRSSWRARSSWPRSRRRPIRSSASGWRRRRNRRASTARRCLKALRAEIATLQKK